MQRVILISLLVVMLFALNCAAQQYVPSENEEIYGRWENADYEGGDTWHEQTWSLTGTYDWDIKGKKFVLAKVSGDRQTLEIAINDSDFPTEVDPDYSGYLIYSRKE